MLEAASLDRAADRAEAASDFWLDRAPPVRPGARVAVVEFAIEVVTEKDESSFDRQLAFLPPSPVTLGLTAVGPLRQRFDFGEGFPQQLADAMYLAFEELAHEQGLELVPPAEVQASSGFTRVPSSTAEEVSTLRTLNLVAIDTGRIKKTTLVPAGGTRLVAGSGRAADAGQRVLLDRLGADAAVRVKIRVGTYRGGAAVMQGSEIAVVTRRNEGRLVSTRSLVASPPAETELAGEAGAFGTREVDQRVFLEGIDDVFPPYAAMALAEMIERRGEEERPAARARSAVRAGA